jgi:small subunit ribosomal protein S3
MGQKVNPKSQRLILNKDWDSRWISQKLFAYTILADNIIRSAVMEKISNAGIARIVIERGNQENKIIIHTSRPGVVIGRSGRGITDLKKYIEKKLDQSTDFKLINSQLSQKDLMQIKKKLSHNLKLSISEIREHQMHAQLVAQDIANQLEKRMPYRKVIKKTISKIESNRKINGIKISVSGRLNGAEIARTEKFTSGSIPLATFKSNVDYAYVPSKTTHGVIGVKVWIYIKDNQ